MLKNFIFIFIGGGLGSVLRYTLSYSFNQMVPYGTWIANILGCLVIGLIIGMLEKQLIQHSIYLLLAVGFCGGFTTFSSFAAENLKMMQNGQTSLFLLYVSTSLLLGIFFAWIGICVSKWI